LPEVAISWLFLILIVHVHEFGVDHVVLAALRLAPVARRRR
jgi:hypothetical protein